MEKGNSEEARVLAGPAACKRYSGPKPPSPEMKKKTIRWGNKFHFKQEIILSRIMGHV